MLVALVSSLAAFFISEVTMMMVLLVGVSENFSLTQTIVFSHVLARVVEHTRKTQKKMRSLRIPC